MTKKIATRDAYGEALVELGEANRDIVVLDADLSKSTKTVSFAKKFPERFFNMGIAEQNLMGTAAGLAAAGKIPFASTFAMFATGRAFEQVRNSIAYPELNVKIAATHAGLTVGEDGGSHQSVEDIALMRAVPKMMVFVPADAVQAKAMVKEAAAYRGPVYIRLGRLGVPVLFEADYRFVRGRVEVLRPGEDVTVFATGIMVAEALAAAGELALRGISVAVVNVPVIKPLDMAGIVAASQNKKGVVTAEEHNIIGGLGSAVAETLAEHYPLPLVRVGVKDVFGESGAPLELLQKYGLTAQDIADGVETVLAKSR